MMTASLLLNLAVLIPVCSGLITDSAWARASYGPPTPARAILLALYFTIGLFSIALLVYSDPRLVAGLLLFQVAYKLASPIAVGTLQHPVVIANLLISAFHLATLVTIWRDVR